MALRTIWDDRYAHLADLPDYVLRDLARNESATHDYRSFAVELLVNRKSPHIAHPDLAGFLREMDIRLEDIEFAKPELGPGPMIASVTTENMWSEPKKLEHELGEIREELDDLFGGQRQILKELEVIEHCLSA